MLSIGILVLSSVSANEAEDNSLQLLRKISIGHLFPNALKKSLKISCRVENGRYYRGLSKNVNCQEERRIADVGFGEQFVCNGDNFNILKATPKDRCLSDLKDVSATVTNSQFMFGYEITTCDKQSNCMSGKFHRFTFLIDSTGAVIKMKSGSEEWLE